MEDKEDYEFEHWFCSSTEMVASILYMIGNEEANWSGSALFAI